MAKPALQAEQAKLAVQQDELALVAVRAHALFPGRTSLRVVEVAKALAMTERQVADLIDEGELVAVDISSGMLSTENPKGKRTSRSAWRIPVSAFDEFINQRKSK